MHFIYILRCADKSLYIGYTTSLSARLRAHNEGHGAAYTFKRRPVALVYTERLPSRLAAIHRERQLKRWTPRLEPGPETPSLSASQMGRAREVNQVVSILRPPNTSGSEVD